MSGSGGFYVILSISFLGYPFSSKVSRIVAIPTSGSPLKKKELMGQFLSWTMDILITRHSDQKYSTELYIKPTHSGITLPYHSAHPKRTKENSLENELRVAARLASDDAATKRGMATILETFELEEVAEC